MAWPFEPVLSQSSGELLTDPATPVWGLLVVVFLLMAIPMGPAEATAVAAGVLVGTASLPLWPAIFAVAAGMLAGDVLAYGAGGPITRRLRRRRKAGDRLRRWQERLDTHPAWRDFAIVGLRFVPGARTPSALIARGTGVSATRFCVLTGTGSVLWAGFWATTGSMVAERSAPVAAGALVVLIPVAVLLASRRLPFRARPSTRTRERQSVAAQQMRQEAPAVRGLGLDGLAVEHRFEAL